MAFHHIPVLFDPVMTWIDPQPDGVYCDGTLGGGGHSEGILTLAGEGARLWGIDRERLARTGILTDFSWWAYAIPGRGELDWAKLLAALKQIGYTGTVSLEHEDALYEGSVEKVQEGLLEGKRYLESLI